MLFHQKTSLHRCFIRSLALLLCNPVTTSIAAEPRRRLLIRQGFSKVVGQMQNDDTDFGKALRRKLIAVFGSGVSQDKDVFITRSR